MFHPFRILVLTVATGCVPEPDGAAPAGAGEHSTPPAQDSADTADTADSGDTGGEVLPTVCASTTFEAGPYAPDRVGVPRWCGQGPSEPWGKYAWVLDAYGLPVQYWYEENYASWAWDAAGQLVGHRPSVPEWDTDPRGFTFEWADGRLVRERVGCPYRGYELGSAEILYAYDDDGFPLAEAATQDGEGCSPEHFIPHYEVPSGPGLTRDQPTTFDGHLPRTRWSWSSGHRSATFAADPYACGRLEFDEAGRLVERLDDMDEGSGVGCDGEADVVSTVTYDAAGRLDSVSKDGGTEGYGPPDGLADETCTWDWNECDRVVAYRCATADGALLQNERYAWLDGVLLAEESRDTDLDGVMDTVVSWTWDTLCTW